MCEAWSKISEAKDCVPVLQVRTDLSGVNTPTASQPRFTASFPQGGYIGGFTLLVLGAADGHPSPPPSFTSGQASWLCTHLSLVTMLVPLKSSETPQPVFRELQLAFCVHSHHDESIVKILDCLQKSLENFLDDLWLVFSAHFFLLF